MVLPNNIEWPIVSYGAFLWGYRSISCFNLVHNRAMRFYLGVCKYTANAAVSGEVGWVPPVVSQWKHIANFWVLSLK